MRGEERRGKERIRKERIRKERSCFAREYGGSRSF